MSEAIKLPEILPCEDCQSARGPETSKIPAIGFYVYCPDCGHKTGCYPYSSDAIHRWNVAFLEWAKKRPALVVRYRNWRGKAGIRRIVPLRTEHRAEPPYHPEPAWLLDAWDCDKRAVRSFVMTGILEVLREEARDE